MKKILLFTITLINFTIAQTQIVNIPDSNFKTTLLNASSLNHIAKDINNNWTAVDLNNDTEIQESEALNIAYLSVHHSIIDLTGIEYFTNLTSLNCSSNQISSIDLSYNINLNEFICSYNQLTSLDISSNSLLTYFDCNGNYLSSLNFNNNALLTYVDCSNNPLSVLDISNNINLNELNCTNNTSMTSLNVDNCTNLSELYCWSDTSLNTINLSNCISLSEFSFFNTSINTIDLSDCTSLIKLTCSQSNLSVLDISSNVNLTYLSCNHNLLTSLDISNNILLTYFNCNNNSLTSLDLNSNINLSHVYCQNNTINSLDISNNSSLYKLDCSNNLLISLDTNNNVFLNDLNCNNNPINSLDLSNNSNLRNLDCNDNSLISLDLSNNNILRVLKCSDNVNLTYINLKKGSVLYTTNSSFSNLPNLEIVCVDALNTNLTSFITTETGHSVTFTEYCNFEPAQSNIINGTIRLDLDNNSCDSNDPLLSNLLITADNGTESFGTFILDDGSYTMFTNRGNFTTAIATSFSNNWSITPASQTNTFIDYDNVFTADFCITPNQTINDVNISLILTKEASPGFVTTYRIVYKNVGTTPLSGSVSLDFDGTKLNFLNASESTTSQSSNNLTFNYTNLNPFETRIIDVAFNVLPPPTVTIDSVLNFNATINPITGDETPNDNVSIIKRPVIGSFDPNDITCLQGDEILVEDIDKYLYYVIRFQNTGTASAINIVVKNSLDNKLDWNTLQMVTSSHQNRVAIKNRSEIEFIFENINLPDSTTDELNSHGFIAYKIKPKTDIALGDIIPNKADIFFDFNEAIETNTATTTIVNTLSIKENTLLVFSVYPTPTENILNIKSKTEIIKIEIYSKLGQLIKETTENNIDVSNLTQGLYFVKVEDINGNFGIKKIVKK